MPSPFRGRSRGSDRCRRRKMKIVEDSPSAAHRARPAELLHRPLGAAAQLARLMQGRAQYVSDVVLPRMAHVAFVRSPHAHARIKSIDASAAKKVARRHRRGHRRGTVEGHHALGRRADASQGHQVGAAARHRRSTAPAGPARRSAPWSRAPAPRPRTAASWSRSTTRNCRPSPIRKPRSIRRRR